MRSEKEMFDLICSYALNDDRVRAVLLNGSRANPNIRKDIFQDYDITYFVTEFDSFKADHSWIDVFGERLILQMPWTFSTETDDYFNYLIQFTDGTRIDLTMRLISDANKESYQGDGLNIVLLDKDGLLSFIQPPNDTAYHIVKPTAQRFFEVCNEFFWVSCYVAKGIWRKELPYAMYTYYHYTRDAFEEMTNWYIGDLHGFTLSVRKNGKLYQHLLPSGIWKKFVSTYPFGDYNSIWDSLFQMCELFTLFARAVAKDFGFESYESEWANVIEYLKHIRQLPPDAKEIR